MEEGGLGFDMVTVYANIIQQNTAGWLNKSNKVGVGGPLVTARLSQKCQGVLYLQGASYESIWPHSSVNVGCDWQISEE